ncbi:putative ABC transporter permease [Clostridium vincentii]|uniref:ABC transporter permease n=1 Tax=Clostridium vincentii TaxID=52704 RepID=A0A2T0BKC1_9CLOT|nr:putative ABC transporter permease [Clostridium vincentii]PRR84309.1 hypothetical protein CLVI_02350 [Clostridium vincentii]
MYFYIWSFFIYSFLGWCVEVIYATVNSRKFVNRGFLNGAVCPIYGFGVVIIIACLTPLKDNIIFAYIGSVLLISSLELITGWLLEKSFHQKWWDYSDMKFNINGYACLKFSLMWGLACLLILNIIDPIIYKMITLIPVTIGNIFLGMFFILIIIDVIVTIQSVINLNKVLKQLNEIALKMRRFSEEFGEKISSGSISFLEKGEELKNVLNEGRSYTSRVVEEKVEIMDQRLEKAKEQVYELEIKRKELLNKGIFGVKRLVQAFPRMKSNYYKELMEELKEKISKY